jgi:hypothetical protein
VGAGAGTLGSFVSAGSQDSDFSDPIHQIVTNGLFTQDYGGATLIRHLHGRGHRHQPDRR